MKTIKELNEKWYWRIIKTIYIILSIILLIIILLYSAKQSKLHSDWAWGKIENRVKVAKWDVDLQNQIIEWIENKNWKVSLSDLLNFIEKKFEKKVLPWILILLIQNHYKEVEWIKITCQNNESCLNMFSYDEDYYKNFIEKWFVEVPQQSIEWYDWYIKREAEIISLYNNYKVWYISKYNFLKKLSNMNVIDSKIDWAYTFWYTLWFLIIFLLIHKLLKWLAYLIFFKKI